MRAAEDGTLELKIDAMVEILFNQQLERLWTVGAAAAVTAVRLAGHARDVRALHMCAAHRVSACCAMDLVVEVRSASGLPGRMLLLTIILYWTGVAAVVMIPLVVRV